MNNLSHTLASAALATTLCLLVAACTGSEQNLWRRDFSKSDPGSSTRPAAGTDVKGYWEGTVAMGDIRTKIEPDRITIALKCDKDGKIVSQASAPIAFEQTTPPRMVLLEDMLNDKDERCGFRFRKGADFRYYVTASGVLQLNFAGSSEATLKRLAE